MNDIVDKYVAYARKIAVQYEAKQVAFADLTGLVEEFALEFTAQVNDLPESQRAPTRAALESALEATQNSLDERRLASQALEEILLSFNRTPIY
ncbi:MAG: hypothetical protein EPN46_02320 [Candidimonas sp.]|nr:MAG: hypothetical protein EPN77_06910 [Candidimonas sp.]TAM19516.1 MAG: hypothetical protein EPN62_18205 [Candidimonas sp.]TAM80168.1 MAG: hypothetical protein EPN46_02320 [Candidimonas sp.]